VITLKKGEEGAAGKAKHPPLSVSLSMGNNQPTTLQYKSPEYCKEVPPALQRCLAHLAELPADEGHGKNAELWSALSGLPKTLDARGVTAAVLPIVTAWRGWGRSRALGCIQRALGVAELRPAKPYAPREGCIDRIYEACRTYPGDDPHIIAAGPEALLGEGTKAALRDIYNACFALALPLRYHRALPRAAYTSGAHPWCSWRPLPVMGYLAAFPLFDEQGVTRNFRFRRLVGDDIVPHGGPKTVSLTGYSTKGLLLAGPDSAACLELGSSECYGERLMVAIAEGEKDALNLKIKHPDWHIFGVGSGSWTPSWGRRLAEVYPDSKVLVATDGDAAGERYARAIIRDLGRHGLPVLRWRASS